MKKPSIPKKWLGAFKAGHRPAAQEFIDEELSWQLFRRWHQSGETDQEAAQSLDYIAKFNNEFYKNVIKKGDTNALHNTDDLRRDCYARENARNRDIMSARRYDRKNLTAEQFDKAQAGSDDYADLADFLDLKPEDDPT